MSYNANELLKLASDFDNLATKALVVEAKKKEKKKLDPKAKLPKNKKSSKKKASEYYDTLISKFAEGQVRPEDVESSKISTQQRIQTINSSSNAADVDSVMEQALTDFRGNQIDGAQYAAISSASIAKKQSLQQAAPATPAAAQPNAEQKYWDDKAKYQAKNQPQAQPTNRIPYNKNVEIAQQQLANMGGFDLGTSGRYGNGVDGQMGQKTLDAFKKYNPYITPQQAIAELVQKYNAGPELPQEEAPPLPNAQTPRSNKTWGGEA